MAPQSIEQTKSLLENEPEAMAKPVRRRELGPTLWLNLVLIITSIGILWNAMLVAGEHERLRLTQLPVHGKRLSSKVESRDRFYVEDPDSGFWMLYAKRMLLEGKWRIRFTKMDNAPFGRPVHWSSPPTWWLIGVYAVVSLIHPGTLITNLSWASYFSSPILECLLLLAVAIMVRRRFGPMAASIAVLALAGYRGLMGAFAPAVVGHHGWQASIAAGALFAMLGGSFGFVANSATGTIGCPSRQMVRRWLILSGFFSGFGFVLGVPAGFLVQAAMGTGTLCILLLIRFMPGDKSVTAYPAAWTWWGGTAALTSLIFYFVEYFPHRFSMVLEANHPLYSLAFFSTGLVMRNLAGGEWKYRWMPWVAWMIGLAGLLLPPLLIKFGPVHWFILKEPHLDRMHANISELQPYLSRKYLLSFPPTLMYWGATFLALIVATRLWINRKTDRFERALLLSGFLGAAILAGVAFLQIRWLNIASVGGFIFLLVTFLVANRHRLPLTLSFLHVGVVFFAVLTIWVQIQVNRMLLASVPIPAGARMHLAVREMAGVLHQLSPTKSPIILAEMGAAPSYGLYEGIRTTGSFYWENDLGVQDWATFFGTTSPEVAKAVAEYRQVDWIVQLAGDSSTKLANQINHRNSLNSDGEMGTLLARRPSGLPPWIQVFDTITIETTPRSAFKFVIYKVTPNGQWK